MSNALNKKPNAEPSSASPSTGVTVNGRYLPPPEDKDGKMWVRTSALILAEPEELYAMWHDIESAPLWQEQILSVTITGNRTSHWVMQSEAANGDSNYGPDPNDSAAFGAATNNGTSDDLKTIAWDSEILEDEPGRRIAWRSTGGDSDNAGEVVFERAPGGRGTIVSVLQEFRMGKITSLWETLVGRNPKQGVIESLRHFKALAETGEIPRIQGQPHGPRGMVAGMKKSMYGETVTTPHGINQKAS